jgi:uncharacterized membrane protein YphA (DoxX/SURF4 family)
MTQRASALRRVGTTLLTFGLASAVLGLIWYLTNDQTFQACKRLAILRGDVAGTGPIGHCSRPAVAIALMAAGVLLAVVGIALVIGGASEDPASA